MERGSGLQRAKAISRLTGECSSHEMAWAMTKRLGLAVGIMLLGLSTDAPGQSSAFAQVIRSSTVTAYARFGWRVAARGDWAAISSPFEEVNGNVAAGRVYLHSRAQNWQQVQIIAPPEAQAIRTFGMSVALTEDVLAIGAPGDHEGELMSGAVYMYRRSGNTWSFAEKIVSPDPVMGGRFGAAVDLSQRTLVVGALRVFGSADRSGAVYVFESDTTSWRLVKKLYPATIIPDEAFGSSVCLLDDSTIAVGRAMSDPIDGRKEAVSIFSQRANVWSQSSLGIPSGGWSDLFGLTLASHDRYLAVGVPGRTKEGVRCGGVIVYDRNSLLPLWTIDNPATAELVYFGGSLSMTGDRIYVGCVQTQGEGRQPMGKIAGYRIAALDTGSAQWYSLDDQEGLPHSCPQVSATDSIVLASSPFCDVGGATDAGMARFFPVSGLVNVEEPAVPLEYALFQNYPNPFNSMTRINYSLKAPGNVKLEMFNILGQRVLTVVDAEMKAGRHFVSFDARQLPSGAYFYRIRVNDFVAVKKMVLVK